MKSLLKKLNIMPILIVIAMIATAFLYTELRPSNNTPKAVEGRLNLKNLDFKKQGVISLDGKWEFYYNQLLTPEDFRGNTYNKPKLTGYIDVPSSWKGTLGQEQLKQNGAGTYRLIIDLEPSEKIFGIRVTNVRMANKLFINGTVMGESGKTALRAKEYLPENLQYASYFSIKGDRAEIIMQVANFHYPLGGIARKIHFGLQRDIRFLDMLSNALELTAVIVVLMFSVYYLALYNIRKADKSFLYASIYFFFLAMSTATNGEKLLFELLRDTPFEITRKLQAYFSVLSIIPLAYFFRAVNKYLVTDKLIKAINIIFIPYALVITFFPYTIYICFQNIYNLVMIISLIIIFLQLLKAYLKKDYEHMDKNEIEILMAILGSTFMFFLSTILYGTNTMNTNIVTMFTFFTFIIFMSLLLAYRFSLAYTHMEKMSERLIKIDKLKDEFLAKTSHELKTPLHGIINISDTLAESPKENLYKNKDLALIKNIALKLSSLVDDILDLTRLKNDNLSVEISSVDLKVCISVTLEIFNYIVQGKNIVFINEVEDNYNVLADERRLRQVLFNLINNAVKHTDKGYIKISSKRDNRLVYIYVEDSGRGIPKDRQSTLFQAYEKFDSMGMGLGLYISHQLVELMYGSIYLDWSGEGEGSRFAFYLPIAEKNTAASGKKALLKPKVLYAAEKLEHHNSLDSSTILVVDDEISNIHVALNLLSKEGYNVLTAFSGEEALEKLKNNKDIDLVMLDIMMPGISGLVVCRKIREENSLVELPILISTVRNSSQDFLLGFEAGANDFITKPFEGKEINARIRTLITMKKSANDAIKSELAFLQAQIKPHFLYNALNTIIYFCYTDGEKAAGLLTDLSKYLRLSFDIDPSIEDTTIERELELVKAYVDIEKARFGDKVNVEYDIDEGILKTKIPTLTIQPLVENSIRHGLRQKTSGGNVYVSIKKVNKEIHIQVKDTGIGMSEEKVEELRRSKGNKKGVGFSNINKRIAKLGGTLSVESIEGLGTKVRIVVGS